MNLKFTKMHGLGNDFVVFDFTTKCIDLSAAQAAKIADRHFGVGCDQILIVENSDRSDIDFKYRILNSDGSEVGQCGNGARCFVRYVHDKGLSDKNPIKVETISGDMVLSANEDGQITVNMGVPKFEPDAIPMIAEQRQARYSTTYKNKMIEFSALSIGNPHAVIIVDNVCSASVLEIGAELESSALFPERANIGFMQINSRSDIGVRVYERGAGETIACGSGTCAAVIAGIQLDLLDNTVTAHLSGGDLKIEWRGEGQPVLMTGPADTTFEGELTI